MESHRYLIYFAHGKDTGPEATKMNYLAQIAQSKGIAVESPDYSDIADPDERVERLLQLVRDKPERLILVGSSMGAYVSIVASATVKPKGLYLLAPAIFLEGYANQNPLPRAEVAMAVHGWNDEIVPVENVMRFAQQHAMELHVLDSDHCLLGVLPKLGELFELFLDQVLK